MQVEEIEGKPLLIPTEEEELDKFVADSPLKHLPRASILARKPTHRSQNTFEDTKGAPLPTMAVLEEMTANLQILIDASCERTAHKKVSKAVNNAVYLAVKSVHDIKMSRRFPFAVSPEHGATQ